MAIQKYYYFNGVLVHWGSVQFLQIIFSFQMYLTSVNTHLIFFLYISYLNPLDTRRRFNVYKTSLRRRCMCLLGKRCKDKKRWNILKKMNSLKKGEGVPLLNFEGGPGVPLLNFEGGPKVPLLNFRGVPGPIFKLWGGYRVPRSCVPGSWSHFYTMPENMDKFQIFFSWI